MKKIVLPVFFTATALLTVHCGARKQPAVTAAPAAPEATAPVEAENLLLNAARQINPNATTAMLDQGKEILNTSCTKCHGFKDPVKFTQDKWNHELDEMIPKAKLTADQAEVLRLYTGALLKMNK